MKLKLCLFITGILLAFVAYKLILILDINKQPVFHHDENCEKVDLEFPIEDFIEFGEYLIGVPSDSIQAFFKNFGFDSVKPGYLVSIHTVTKKVSKIPITGFPDQYIIVAHGITIYDNKTLYVLSHSYSKGAEIIFLFDLELSNGEVTAKYIKKISISEEHGIYNAIAVINSQYFYITQWLAVSDTEKGRDHSFFTSMKRNFYGLFTQSCAIKLCMALYDVAVCSPVDYGMIPNGIIYRDNTLYVADSSSKEIYIYDVLEAYQVKRVAVVGGFNHGLDNLQFKNGQLYAAGISRIIDFIELSHKVVADQPLNVVAGGISRIYRNSNKWVVEEVIMQNKLSFPTTGSVIGNEAVISSITDSAVLFCKI